MAYLVAVLCALGMALGQILFKQAALGLKEAGTIAHRDALLPLVLALGCYGLTSLVWVWVLQHVELGRVYPIMALAFVLVPLASYVLFGERFSPQYFVGVLLIVAGIAIAVRS